MGLKGAELRCSRHFIGPSLYVLQRKQFRPGWLRRSYRAKLMDYTVGEYSGAHFGEWDGLIADSTAGTILQTRRFLSYHGNRFEDASLCVWDGRTLVGVLPAARDSRDERTVVSHPGI